MYGNLNSQKYQDEISRPIIAPFIHHDQFAFQYYNAWPKVDISGQVKMSQFLQGLHTYHTFHTLTIFGILWLNVYNRFLSQMNPKSNASISIDRFPFIHSISIKSYVCCVEFIFLAVNNPPGNSNLLINQFILNTMLIFFLMMFI